MSVPLHPGSPASSSTAAAVPSERPAIDRSLLIEGLGKGLRLIQCFNADHPRLTATEAGRLTGMTRTAARRYLLSLVHYGYADTDGKHYWLLPTVLGLGQSYLEAARLPRLVQPALQRLSAQTGEAANLSVLDGHQVLYLVRSNSARLLAVGFQPGARAPAHVVSPGPVLLAAWSEAALEAWLAEHDFGRYTPATVTDPAQFRDAVSRARDEGHARIEQHAELGLAGLAVPLHDHRGHPVGALSITYPTPTWPEDSALRRLLPPLRETALALRSVL